MAISTNGTVFARLAGGLYNTVMSNSTYLEVASQDPSTLANTLYSRDFAKSTDLAVATTLLANLGLAGQAGLDAWVAAQLTAAGAANKGAKIVSLLNDFAGLASDATWGTYATAFNTKVDAALAASQKTDSVEAKFANAGTVAVANATFTLTSGADTFTGGAGNDSFVASGTTLTAGDVLTGQAGDSLTITDLTASFAAGLPANVTVTGIPTATITTTGKLGTTTTTGAAQATTYKFEETKALGGTNGTTSDAITFSHTPSGTTTAVTSTATMDTADDTGANAAAKVAAALKVLYQSLGYAVTTTANTVTATADIAAALPTTANTINIRTAAATASTAAGTTTVTVTGAPGTAYPIPTLTTAVGNSLVPVIATTAATDTAASSSFAASAMTGLTSLTATSVGGANIASAKTMDVTLTNTSGVAQVSSAKTVSVTGTTNSVYVSAASGPVTVVTTTPSGTFGVAGTASSNGTGTLTGLATSWGTYTWSGTTGTLTTGKAGVLVTGGTTVSVTEAGGTITTSASTSANSTVVQIGSAVNVSSAGSLTGTETIRNLAINPTGDVTVSRVTAYTDADGLKNVRFGSGATDIYTNGAATVSVTGSGTVTIVDVGTTNLVPSTGVAAAAGTSKLATVNLGLLSGNASITSDAITTVSVKDTLGTARTVTINNSGKAGANSGAFNLQVSNSGSSSAKLTLDNATATSLNISSASATAYEKVDGASGTASNSSSKSWITLTTPKATSITMTNSLAIDIGTATSIGKVGTINASGASGAVTTTIGSATEYGMIFTGGSGKDSVTLTGDVSVTSTTKATTVALGAGDDKLLNSSATTTFTGATFDGGDGNDTVSASLITVGNASKFTNFETLGLDRADGTTTDITVLGGLTGLSLVSAASGATATYTSVTQAKGLTVGATTAGGTTVLDFGSTVAASTDAYTVTFAATGATTAAATSTIDAGFLSIEGIEAVTIVSGGSGFAKNTIDLTNASARTLTITGAQAADIGFLTAFGANNVASTSSAGVSLIDASALTGKLTLDAANVKTAFAGTTIKGGSNDDTITLALETSASTATYTVDGGAGNDTFITANEKSTLTGGAGNDNFDVTATKATVANATGLDGALIFTTITDFAAGDTITMGTTSVTIAGKAFVSTATSLTSALDLALKGSTVDASGKAVWFVYGGDTYVAVEDGTDGLSSTDMIVKLTGVTSDLAWTNITSGLIGIA